MSPLPGTGFPGDEHFARNLIGGSWQFPAVPFEYEIRSPRGGSVIAAVPLSSRLDVARAVRAARSAARSWAEDPELRRELLTGLVSRLGEFAGPLAELQSAETGLSAAVTCLRAGGNVLVAGRDADAGDVASVAAGALRVHSAGGPLALPVLCAREEVAGALTEAVAASLAGCRPAPLPAEPLRDRALAMIAEQRAAGARLIRGGAVPDDARHRMSWIVPPTLLAAGHAGGPAGRAVLAAEPTGPVLTIVTWRSPGDLAGLFAHPRYADGLACAWGLDDAALAAGSLPPAWTGGPGQALRHHNSGREGHVAVPIGPGGFPGRRPGQRTAVRSPTSGDQAQ